MTVVVSVTPQQVAARYTIRDAARRACRATFRVRTASTDLTEQILVACAESALIPDDGSQVRVAGLMDIPRKMLEVAKVAKKFPALWDKVKDFLGVSSLSDLPGRMRELVKEGYAALRKVVGHLFNTWPLKLYALPENKVFSVAAVLDRIMKAHPGFAKWLDGNVKPRVDQFDRWLRESLPTISKVLMVAIYVWVWVNVTEFEWDMKGILDAATGHLTLFELLKSLPGSVLGAVLGSLNLGTFTLLPAALAARLMFLIGHRYVSWSGSGFVFDTDKLRADFGISEVVA